MAFLVRVNRSSLMSDKEWKVNRSRFMHDKRDGILVRRNECIKTDVGKSANIHVN